MGLLKVRRVSKKHNHSVKIKASAGMTLGPSRGGRSPPYYTPGSQAKVRARGSRSQQWYAESRAQLIRRKVRTQSAWNLHLAFRGGTGRVPGETFQKTRSGRLALLL